jgi:ectoine hydroxylase-related dioxygenase (phytanoyl-CoA dioxygenase family)
MALTAEELRFYQDNGFVLKKGLIGLDSVAAIKAEIADIHQRMAQQTPDGVGVSWEVYEGEDQPRLIKQLMNSELVSPTLNALLRSDLMLDIIEQLIGPEISLYHSKLLLKSSRDGTAVPWHQDYAYWQTEGNQPLMVNCQMAIDRSTRDNGCIQFVPGSHKWGLQEHARAEQTFGRYLPGPDYFYERDDAVAVEMEPGDGVFFNALIVHGSAPNTSTAERRMNTFAYNVTGNNIHQCREILRSAALAAVRS